METWYRLSMGRVIRRYDVERTTTSMVVFRGGGKERKDSDYHSWHPTYEAARGRAIADAEREVKDMEAALERVRGFLDLAMAIPESELTKKGAH